MPLINLVIILVVVGVLLFVVNKYLAEVIDAKILKIINVVVVIAVVLYVLSLPLGGFGSISTIRVGR